MLSVSPSGMYQSYVDHASPNTHPRIFFLFVYSQAVRQPLDKLNHQHFDEWEGVLYAMTLAFTFEGSSFVPWFIVKPKHVCHQISTRYPRFFKPLSQETNAYG